MNRRTFLQALMLTATGGLTSLATWADDDEDDNKTPTNVRFSLANTGITNKHVVIVGGGMAGATAAKYLRLWGGAGVSVTLVEPNPIYVSNIMSGLVLAASRTLSSLNYSYTNLINNYGISLKQASVVSFDNTRKIVTLSDNSSLSYDRLIFATGIQLDDAHGLTAADYAGNYPHAWQSGPQTSKLASLIANMGNNDTFVMTIPAKPYRCPPGPYERACLVADYLKRTGKTGAKVIVLDENTAIAGSDLSAPYNAIQAEPHSFHQAFTQIHTNITYLSGVTGISVTKSSANDGSGSISCSAGNFSAQVINIIPPHRAPNVMTSLCNGGRWAPVNVLSYESTVTNMTGIHVIGDSSQTTQPKAGHIANQEAKVCSDAIIRAFQNQGADPAPVTNSACYSPITNSTASWLTGVYQYDATSKTMRLWANGAFTDKAIESADISSKNFSKMSTWFNTLMGDSFS